ncbi:hypothetical protein SEMRO_335_G120051.1 [Seminavis robusta]|uniref:Uncharacterized protein n=1 Tax=Seminavis robusta TaxID=568900 RepID=A0A9N8DSB9_9STRA|nr:hypothetical protein SEMRO_335_G120051.1 [Seminavis robusta]|eukprot:Sro335_g120051.1  (116) ;mRNA; f:32755-33102
MNVHSVKQTCALLLHSLTSHTGTGNTPMKSRSVDFPSQFQKTAALPVSHRRDAFYYLVQRSTPEVASLQAPSSLQTLEPNVPTPTASLMSTGPAISWATAAPLEDIQMHADAQQN